MRDLLANRLRNRLFAILGWTYIAYSYLLPQFAYSDLHVCPFNLISGIPCPLCGTTRSWHAILHGDIIEGFSFNVLAPFFLVVWMAITLVLSYQIALEWEMKRTRRV